MDNELLNKIFIGNELARCIDQKKEIEFIHWEYDDGTQIGVVVDDEKDKIIFSKQFPDKQSRKKMQKELAARYEKRDFEFDKNKIEIRTGLRCVDVPQKKINRIKKSGKKYGEEFLKMTTCCGSDIAAQQETMKVVSGILAGYVFDSFMNLKLLKSKQSITLVSAPILACARNSCEELLSDMAHSLMIDTSEKNNSEDSVFLRQKQPCVLPVSIKDRRTVRRAHIILSYYGKKYDEEFFPAQYRETSVYVKGQYFPKGDLMDFQRRNCKASIVVSGVNDSHFLMDPIWLDYKVLANYSCQIEWDCELLNEFALGFVDWLGYRYYDMEKKKRKDEREAEDEIFRKNAVEIDKHNRKKGTKKIRGISGVWLQTQLRVVDLVAEFGELMNCWSREERDYLSAKWKNLLLPGICEQPEPTTSVMKAQAVIIPEVDDEKLFRQVLTEMLLWENFHRFRYVPPHGYYPTSEGNNRYLGYVRKYRGRKGQPEFDAIVFRLNTFAEEAKRLFPSYGDWYKIIASLRDENLPYLHPTKQSRMPEEENDSRVVQAIILRLDDLDYIPVETRAAIKRVCDCMQSSGQN